MYGTAQEREEAARRHTYHPPKNGQAERYAAIRSRAADLADLLVTLCPPSREKSLAQTHLDEVVFWANASIARNE